MYKKIINISYWPW